ncbi:hypothetical protein APHAL10511_003914 [Amanita phalloides]|nr:hypothetical protein APHAL10511_003914 [Amanita phalloides]
MQVEVVLGHDRRPERVAVTRLPNGVTQTVDYSSIARVGHTGESSDPANSSGPKSVHSSF